MYNYLETSQYFTLPYYLDVAVTSSNFIFTPQPLRLRGIVVPRAGGRQGRQAPLTLSRP